MARSLNTPWLRDELVLTLDLYVREGMRPALALRRELSHALRSFPEAADLSVASEFRDVPSMNGKLREFAVIDPDDPTVSRLDAGAAERAIWDEFANDHCRLRSEAKAVRTRLYDVVAFLRARTKPLEDPHSNARFSVVECTPDRATYRRVRARVNSGTVATAPLQEILNEVLDRARGGRTFRVEVPTRFEIDHGKFANAVIAGIAGQVFDLYDGFGEDVEPTSGSDTVGETRSPREALDSEKAGARPRSAELGVAYVSADESAAVAESDPFATDPDMVERGTRSHARLQNQLAAEVASAGLVPLSPAADDPPFDLAWRDGSDLHVAEVKSTTATNEEHKLRLGLGQLLRYRHALSTDGTTVHATLYVERQPADTEWSNLCQSLGITLRWPTP